MPLHRFVQVTHLLHIVAILLYMSDIAGKSQVKLKILMFTCVPIWYSFFLHFLFKYILYQSILI